VPAAPRQAVKRILPVLFTMAVMAALVGMAYGQYALRLDPSSTEPTALFMIAAVAAALLLGRRPAPVAAQCVEAVRRGPAARWAGRIGIVLGLAAVGAGTLVLCRSWQTWFFHGWGLWFGGTAVLSAGLWVFDPPRDPSRAWTRAEVAVLLGIVALGTFLRFYRYGDFPDPFGMHAIEEPQVGMRSYLLLKEHVHGWEFLFDNYLGALGILLTGDRSFTAIRIPFTIVSALTIVPLYFALRQLVTVPAALGGAFLFAVSSWNIIYSRCAHAVFPTNLLVVTVLALVLHFARNGRLTVIPWAALLSGYTLYSYAAYRGTTLFMLLLLSTLVVRDLWRRRQHTDLADKQVAGRAARRDLWAMLIFLAMVPAMAAPIVAITSSNQAQPMYYFEAANRSLSNKEYYTSDRRAFIQQRLRRMRDAAKIFMHFGDGSTTFNAPGEPMVDPLTSVLFVGGLCLAACYPGRGSNGFLLLMFLGLMFGSTVFVQNLDVRRTQGVTPFVAIFAALFLDRLWLHVRRLPRALLWIATPVLIGSGAVFATWWNYDVYFHKMADNPVVRQAFKNFYTVLIHYGRLHPDRQMIVLTDIHHFFEPSDYFWMIDGLMHGQTLWDINEVLPPHQLPASARPQTIIIQNPYERQAIARLLTDVYPGMRCTEFVEPEYWFVTLTTCDVPAGAAHRPLHTTLEGRYWLGSNPAGPPTEVRAEPFIGYATMPPVCSRERPIAPETCYAEWAGTLQIPVEGDYVFVTKRRGDANIEVRIDGRPLTPQPLHLTPGPHEVTATARMRRSNDSGVGLEWKRNGEQEPVPFYTVAADQVAAPVPQGNP
jgi:hypothetical protein